VIGGERPPAADPTAAFYRVHHDRVRDKRYDSPYWLRRHATRTIYDGFLRRVGAGQTVLDAGCGDGVLSTLMAERGARVTGLDLSAPNLAGAARRGGAGSGPAAFVLGDTRALPFRDASLDVVVSCHVLEHLPDPRPALRELRRVARERVLIAMPTCLNPAAWSLLGGANYWQLTLRAPLALPWGLLRTAAAWITGRPGPDEGYAGRRDLPHVWRFPWVMRRQIEAAGLAVVEVEAGPLILPYVAEYAPRARAWQERVQAWRGRPLLRFLGYGTLMVCVRR
jgi:SAM-dependent methyltransferase